MRLAILAALLLFASAPRAQPGSTVTIKGHVDAGRAPVPEGGLWVYVVDKDRSHRRDPRAVLPKQAIRQVDTSFVPHVLVVPKGTEIEFPNKDSQTHNVFSPDPYFDLDKYGPGESKSRKFTATGPETSIYCDIHKCMWARVKVVDTDYIQQADAKGAYEFHLPPGTYEVYAWAIASNDVPSETKALAAGETWELPPLHVQLGTFDRDHKNKTAQEYPSPQYGARCH